MTDASPIAAILACAVPVAAGVVVFKRPLAAAWDGPVCRELRNSHWSVRAVALAILCMATVHAFEKSSGGTNAIQSAESGPTNAVSVAASTNAVESATDAETLARALEDLDEAEAIRLGLEPQPAAAGVPLLPTWYKYDPADADQDFIPDLWETWTRSAPATFDSHLDLDDDGLNALYEFWNQTDPRTADTDGDGFTDGFESSFDPPVTNINPLVKADFTPVEPDANADGIPDLWEGSGFLYGFHDSDHDGFDDTYATYFLPAPSDANFDVVVDVRSSRTAALVWPTPTGDLRMVLPPTATGTVVRLRLPFGEDQALRLLPAPEGVAPPAGQLWKSRLRVSLLARAGQTAAGTCLVAADGAIVQRVATRESAVARFPDDPAPPSGSPSGDWPIISVLERRFGVVPGTESFHFVGEGVGPFVATNAVNVDLQTVVWSADHGTMSPTNGPSSLLTVEGVPPNDGPVTVTARIPLDPLFYAEEVAKVWPCPRRDFSVDSCTTNFSPHLGEEFGVSVTLPGCSHFRENGWLEAEVVRVTTAGTQHVAWVDMDPSSTAIDSRRAATNLPQQASFAWDGRAQASLPLADHPDVFTGTKGSFHRAMPAIVSGEPVPPPFLWLVVRFWNEAQDTVLAEETRKFFVPQVVNITLFDNPEWVFMEPILTTNSNLQVTLYPGCTESNALAELTSLPAMAMAFFPADVNIRIVMTNGVAGQHKTMLVLPESSREGRLGENWGFKPRNESPDGETYVFVRNAQEAVQNNHQYIRKGGIDVAPFPFTPHQYALYLVPVIPHEIGHSVGLVDPRWFGAIEKGPQMRHNKPYTRTNMMDPGGLFFIAHKLNPSPTQYWKPDNLRYLRFVLPRE